MDLKDTSDNNNMPQTFHSEGRIQKVCIFIEWNDLTNVIKNFSVVSKLPSSLVDIDGGFITVSNINSPEIRRGYFNTFENLDKSFDMIIRKIKHDNPNYNIIHRGHRNYG